MKNKIQLIDVSMLSTYMGRWLTLIIALIVLGLAVSALMSGGTAERNIIDMCVSARALPGDPMAVYEPLRKLLSRHTRRPAVLATCDDEWPSDADVYIMPTVEYLRYGKALSLTPLFEIVPSERPRNRAVIVARADEEDVEWPDLGVGDIVFSDPASVNGFWLPISRLAALGFDAPASLEDFNFAGSRGDGTRTVMAVVYRAYRFAACTRADIDRLTARGIIRRDELRIVHSEDALPEIIVACPERDAAYYRRKLGTIARRLDEVVSPVHRDGDAQLMKSLGIKGLRPADPERVERARQLYEQVRDYF